MALCLCTIFLTYFILWIAFLFYFRSNFFQMLDELAIKSDEIKECESWW